MTAREVVAFEKWVSSVTRDGAPLAKPDPDYYLVRAAFYSGWNLSLKSRPRRRRWWTRFDPDWLMD